MIPATNFILVAIGFVCVSTGIVLAKKRRAAIAFGALGLVLFVVPFFLHWLQTRDAYDWVVVVERPTTTAQPPRSVYVRRIEWITDYTELKRQRGHVGSVLLDADTTRKEWRVKGFVPVAIRAELLIGSDEIAVTRNFNDLGPGSYTFTLSFDHNEVARWNLEAHGE